MSKEKVIKTILISGATGFLGSNLMKRLVDHKYEVVILKRSFSNTIRINNYINKIKFYDIDKVGLEKCFLENNIDVFIHCATDYGRKEVDPLQIIEANLIIPLRLVEIGLKNNCSIFLNTDSILDKGVNSYSLSKKQFLDWFKIYSDRSICINLVLEHFYGPFDDKSKFVSSIIDKLINNASQINLTLGEQKRDFVYIDDVVDAFNTVLRNIQKMDHGFYNFEIGAGKLTTIREVVTTIKGLTGNVNTNLNFGAIPYRINEIMEPKMDISPLKQLGWKPKTNLAKGLKKTIENEKKSLIK
jgi:nucleoside-diphosphate-sugar epimerase